ncbi:cell division protein ZipA [Piscirickettsia salmonis]|uniref:cell division protein ZipA C-terminal FtsZ-binding domain-containing protein n=1 Tax=Piscirickettsia salmonis TaxID=1238 RepID=UPI0012BACD50|nr:cell division protein ZipA C-terminal FtsZ-binding domain-containing protein [Piscirickettsia salmonis]QGP55217.1 cell division protein ZipA [Piscirickettsia salmonis]QGP58927.1 cell division protein ZipA [Piscirickettsia salmonis]QGP64782.1 cell division protein ZipA [Piscirickettsia salmonis]
METFLKVLVLLVGILLVWVFIWEGLRRLKVWRIRKWGVKRPLQMRSGDPLAEDNIVDDVTDRQNTQDNQQNQSQYDRQADTMSVRAPEPNHIILNIYIESKSTGFLAYALFSLLKRSGLIFNDELQVFESKNEQGEVDFYITSAVAPGVFDIKNAMVSIPAVSVFARPDLQTNPRMSFFKLLESTHTIASELDGRVLNMRREILSEASVSADYLSVVNTYAVAESTAVALSASNSTSIVVDENMQDDNHVYQENESHVIADTCVDTHSNKDQHVAS